MQNINLWYDHQSQLEKQKLLKEIITNADNRITLHFIPAAFQTLHTNTLQMPTILNITKNA